MTGLSHDRYCTEITAQTELLSSRIQGADPNLSVPSCPGWTVGDLVRHVGRLQRWAEQIVRTRATSPLPVEPLPADLDESPAVLGPWLVRGAERLADALRAAGPDTPVWTSAGSATTAYYARRFTHETAIHRVDADLARGADFILDQDLALDAIDEWLELASRRLSFESDPRTRELLGPGHTLHLHATDTPAEAAAEWVVDLTGDAPTWRRAHEKAAVAVRGPLIHLLLVVYKRRPTHGEGIEILGDAPLLDFWLDRVSFEQSIPNGPLSTDVSAR
jgi:uncharacterized protein (TIGR03083 family)